MNIYDIAEEAGVSISTVSRVLNNKSIVKAETREKIEAVLARHQYSPSPIARALVSKNMNTVGILTIDIRVPHYAMTAYALERELYRIGYNAILCNTGGKAENGVDYIQMLLKKGVSGIILIGSVFQNKFIEDYMEKSEKTMPNIPFIVMNSQIHSKNVYAILINHESGMVLAIEHLKERGHDKIFFVQDADTFSGKRKADSFIKVYGEYTGKNAAGNIIRTERGVYGGMAAVDRILASKKKVNAIIFGDDTTAVGGIQRLHRLGYHIPDDFAIIGWNHTGDELCEPRLTTIDNQDEMMSAICIKMLENLLEGTMVTPTVSVDSNLIIGQST
jgi:LacI family transcriptional regulator